MRKVTLALGIILLCLTASHGQAVFARTPTVTTATFTVTVSGGGTGAVSSADGLIVSCSTSCVATESIGGTVTLTLTPTGGSAGAWVGGTGGSGSCSGALPCTFVFSGTGSITALFTASGGTTITAAPFFLIDLNNWNHYPNDPSVGCGANSSTCIPSGGVRMWDLFHTNWAQTETAPGVYDFTTVDVILHAGALGGSTYISWVLGRTPSFYSSNPGDTTCAYYTYSGGTVNWRSTWAGGTAYAVLDAVIYNNNVYAALLAGTGNQPDTSPTFWKLIPLGNTPGQCAMPTDINPDGTGTDSKWRNFIAAAAAHVNSAGYLAGTGTWAAGGANCPGVTACTHAPVKLYEILNETDTNKFCGGVSQALYCTMAQQHRMQDDAYCIIKGSPTTGGVAFTVAATGESCSTVRSSVTSVTLSGPIDTTATIAMPSMHTTGAALTISQNYLYCNNTPPANCGGGAHTTTDILNYHLKPGNSYVTGSNNTTSMECILQQWYINVEGGSASVCGSTYTQTTILQAAELAKAFFNTEGGYAAADWVAPFTDVNLQEAFVSRFNIYSYCLGFGQTVWYKWAQVTNGLGSSNANLGYIGSETWMLGSTAPVCSHTGTVYTATFTLSKSVAAAAVWDIDAAYLCSGSPSTCPTHNVTVGSSYLSYVTLDSSTPVTITSHLAPVGAKPILVQAQ